MNLFNIAAKSMKRRKTRTIFLVFGLTIAIATVISLYNITEGMNSDISTKLDEFGANLLITPKSEELPLSYGGISLPGVAYNVKTLNMRDVASIKKIKNRDNIKTISPKLISVAEIKDKKVLVAGIDFENEIALKKWWKIIGKHPGSKDEALIGSEVQIKLHLNIGDSLAIAGHHFSVSGILHESGSQDDQLVMINLTEAQNIFHKPSEVSLIEVAALCYDCPIEEIVSQTSGKLPNAKVSAIKQTISAKMESISHFENFSAIIMVFIAFVAALIVFTSMTASVNEKKKEIGVFRAIGFRQSHIIAIILIEAVIVSLFAGILGYGAGLAISVYAITLFGLKTATIAIFNSAVLWAIVLSLFIGVSASLFPSINAAKTDPSIALRSI